MPGALEFARMGLIPAGAYDNRRFLQDDVTFAAGVEQELQDIMFDPQTSGGLLIPVKPEMVDLLLENMHQKGVSHAVVIGKVIPPGEFLIEVR